MCSVHHKVIDDQVEEWPVERLLTLKREHEAGHAGGTEPSSRVVQQILVQLQGPVTMSGDAVDLRGATGMMYRPTIVQRDSVPEYRPPELPPEDELAEPGALPPGSSVPFARNAAFTGREEGIAALAAAVLYK